MRPDIAALPKIFCAADVTGSAEARVLIETLLGTGLGIKFGLEFFNAQGPDGVSDVIGDDDLPLFLDLKYHDIPNTVAGAVRGAMRLRPAYLNVHAAGGATMMRAAADAAREAASQDGTVAPRLLAVTVLTSLDATDLQACGVTRTMTEQVLALTELALDSGMDGVVCSAHEIAPLRARFGPEPVLMVPGIRPAGSDKGDQKRTMTPRDALAAGATHLVIGRPITAAANRTDAIQKILRELR